MSGSSPIRPEFFTIRDYIWMISTFAITPIVASLLSIGGYIPVDPYTAAIDGLLVSIVYVGYRILDAYRRLTLYCKQSPAET